MRYRDLFEGKYLPTLETFPRQILRAGTRLWHGSNTAGDREMQNGPAWFAWTPEKATSWAGWASPPDSQKLGDNRLWEYVVTADVVCLLDLNSIPHDRNGTNYARFCEMLTGDIDELGFGTLAQTIKENDLAPGWWATGRDGEIMLCHPNRWLRFVEVRKL